MSQKRRKKTVKDGSDEFQCFDDLSKHAKFLIKELTHSGETTLNASQFKELKSICKKSNDHLNFAYKCISRELTQNHSEIRYSAFQLIDEFCRRSLVFRELVVHNLQNILELTTEIESKKPLPLPRKAAERLQKLALKTVHDWYEEFGSKYKTFECAIKFLQRKRQVDFKSLQVLSAEERERRAENERRTQSVNEQRFDRVNNEFNDLLPEIISTVKAFENGLALLLPRPEDFYISEEQAENESDMTGSFFDTKKSDNTTGLNSCSSSDDDEPEEDFNPTMREIGALTNKHTIEVDIVPNSIKETPENSVILENVKDANKLIMNNYLPKIKAWMQIVSKVEGSPAFLKKLVDYKNNLEKAIERYRRLNIVRESDDDCVSTDSELEEVVEDDELRIKKEKKCKKTDSPMKKSEIVSNWSIVSKEEKSEDPTTVQALLASQQKKDELSSRQGGKQSKTETNTEDKSSSSVCDDAVPSTSKETNQEINERKRKLLEKAPKLPFDIDLYHWEDTELKAPTILPVALDGHRFWSSVSDDNLELTVPEGSSMLRTRVIEYVGEFEPILRSCRYPLPSGKLCPRQDRYKCPFHGPIVPRDELGKCVNAEDELRQRIKEEKQNAEKPPDWQEPALLEAIKAETGIDLKMPDKKGKQKKKKYPNLTDIKKSLDTTTNRLNKKIFDKASMKRVANRLDSIDRRRYRDKFGDQFNYMYE
ncbi:UV-stimulated scaffold protein A [Nilaparvata lugens]|uniref:UV-stimulated scaffold protein A n=1 Tax=Nilaparvata lugens TaxID=108931 RepID=UPI00193D59CF|nr:UV-stimulated scaffold protein A [Nilaparvata lugens]